MKEKYEELFKKELQEGIIKKSIPIIIKAIIKFRLQVNPQLINIATQIVISMAEVEMEKESIDGDNENIDKDYSDKDTLDEETSDKDYQDKEIIKIKLSGSKTAPKKRL